MVFDVRRPARLPRHFVGNAFHLAAAPSTAPPWHEQPLAEVCARVHALALRPFEGNALDDPRTLSGGWLASCRMLEQGKLPPPPQPGGAAASLALVANFQAHLPSFAGDFGAGVASGSLITNGYA